MISSSLRSPMIRLVHLPSFSLVLLVLPMPLSGKRLVILVVWNDYENKVTKLNTTTQEVSEVRNRYNGGGKWSGGTLHSNGYIYIYIVHQATIIKY